VESQRTGASEKRATRLIFLLCGIGQSAWAPLVPYAKARVHANDQEFGLLLLCFGVGSIVSMPSTGALTSRYGCKTLIQIAACAVCLALVSVSLAPTKILLALALIFFGASIGSLDVVMNVQALLVERAGTQNLMPGFHALYSVGGISGAVLVSCLLWIGAPVWCGALVVVLALIALLMAARGSLLPYGEERKQGSKAFVLPGRHVLLIGVLAFMMMLVEGSMLDWSAVYLVDRIGMLAKHAGIGYAAFSVAMTLSRFSGNKIVTRLGRVWTIILGALVAAAGYALTLLLPYPFTTILAFGLIGLGAANLVPLLFTLASEAQGALGSNVSFVTTLGYSGILAGPAVIGFIVHASGFPAAFGGLAGLLFLVALLAKTAADGNTVSILKT
jgi:MFS family permease